MFGLSVLAVWTHEARYRWAEQGSDLEPRQFLHMRVGKEVICAAAVPLDRDLRGESVGSETAARGVGEVEMVGADVVPGRLGQMHRVGRCGQAREPGKIEARRPKGIGRQKIVDGIGRYTDKVRVIGATIDISEAVGSQRANPRCRLVRCLRQRVLIVAFVERTPDAELFEFGEANRRSRPRSGLTQRGQQQAGQYRDDGDDHQQFDQCKSMPLLHLFEIRRYTPRVPTLRE
jgi:hypothetical protein